MKQYLILIQDIWNFTTSWKFKIKYHFLSMIIKILFKTKVPDLRTSNNGRKLVLLKKPVI